MLTSMRELIDRAAERPSRTLAVAAAEDADVLKAVLEARGMGIADAVLTGDPEGIRAALRGLGAAEEFEIVPAQGPGECAAAAVGLVREGRADCLMKGRLSTADMMRAVIDREKGLGPKGLLSHIMLYEVPGYPKILVDTDGGMNTYPTLEQKAGILENAAAALKRLGYERIYAACIAGAEAVNPKIPATVDAAALAAMGGRWAPYNMQVIGPVGLDLAISPSACAHKGYSAPGAGEADILLMPTYEVGNGIGKALTYFANAKSAGIVVGTAPIVLVSRADTAEMKLYSIALGCLAI